MYQHVHMSGQLIKSHVAVICWLLILDVPMSGQASLCELVPVQQQQNISASRW